MRLYGCPGTQQVLVLARGRSARERMGNIKNRQLVDRSLVKGILDLGVELTSDVYIHHSFDDDEAADLLRALAPEMTSSQVNGTSKKAARIWAALESASS